MRYVHNLLESESESDASRFLGNPKPHALKYIEDVGFWDESLISLLAIVTQRNQDDDYEQLVDEIQGAHAEKNNTYVTFLAAEATRCFAEISESELETIAHEWDGFEDDEEWQPTKTPLEKLKLLTQLCQAAIKTNSRVAIYSHEENSV